MVVGDGPESGQSAGSEGTGGGDGQRVVRSVVRDESEQSRYFSELPAVFEEEDLDAAFWFTYAGWRLPHRPDAPGRDLDLGSYGVQAVLPDGSLRPKEVKEVYGTLSAAYAARTARGSAAAAAVRG